MATERVTVTLPVEMLEEIDRSERNRSRFVLEAVRREIQRRRREDLRRSLCEPHAETSELADAGFEDWAGGASRPEAEDLVDPGGGRAIRWDAEHGWIEAGK